jgi:hypothetical protein
VLCGLVGWFGVVIALLPLQECENWMCDGWRNDKAAFKCALSGVDRGEVMVAAASRTMRFAV